MRLRLAALNITLLASNLPLLGQTAAPIHTTAIAATAPTVVPALVPFTAVAEGTDGKLLTGEVSMTFLLFKDEAGGEPLWTESQRVVIDAVGHYSVQLGSSSPSGIPLSVFATGEARWLEVQISGQKPQARVLLSSVPYAAKAADAATLGGLPASAFVLAGTAAGIAASSSSVTPDSSSNVTTTGGTSKYLPVFNGASTVIDSEIYDTGKSVGIGVVPNASVKLDVGGGMIMRGPMIVSRTGNASASTAYPSFGFAFYSNAYNSSTKAADNPHFLLQSEPTGNNTANTGATFNLLYSNHGAAPAETGLSINPSGILHFATGQTFPGTGTGNGTLTGVTAGTALTGGGTSGTVTLNLDTSKVPLLSGGNTFNNTQLLTGNLTVFGTSVMAAANLSGPVGIGTSTPGSMLELSQSARGALGPVMTLTNPAGQANAADAIDFNTSTPAYGSTYVPGAEIRAIDAGGYTDNLYFYSNLSGALNNGYQQNMEIAATGQVGIGTDVTGYNHQLAVVETANTFGAIEADGITLPSGSFAGSGGDGVEGNGGDSTGSNLAGDGAFFIGGNNGANGTPGDGMDAYVGTGGGSSAYAGYFSGDVFVDGILTSDNVDLKIDHPSDPANKYLFHTAVESSEQMNIYTGNITTDELGLATVTLPSWFEVLNTDFRYQLTVIGQFAQAIIKDKIADGKFRIMTNAAHVEVSWQVTAVRQDAFAKAHPLVVEQEKSERERGFYLHPEYYGQPQEKQTEWARHPRQMQTMKTRHEAAANGKSVRPKQ